MALTGTHILILYFSILSFEILETTVWLRCINSWILIFNLNKNRYLHLLFYSNNKSGFWWWPEFKKRNNFPYTIICNGANDVCSVLLWFISWFLLSLSKCFVCNLILCLLYSYNDDVMWPESGLQNHSYEHSHTEHLRKLHYLRRLLDSIIYLLSFCFSC